MARNVMQRSSVAKSLKLLFTWMALLLSNVALSAGEGASSLALATGALLVPPTAGRGRRTTALAERPLSATITGYA